MENQIIKRVWELDLIRGICITAMVFDHVLYDLTNLFNVKNYFLFFYFDFWGRDLIRAFVVIAFILVSGISSSFTHSNLKRGLKLLLVAMALTLFTYVMEKAGSHGTRYLIIFGVLHMFSFSILFYAALENIKKRKALLYLGSFLALIGIFFLLFNYSAPANMRWLWFIVDLRNGFFSADYFPLLPYLGVFLIGAYLGPVLYPERKTIKPLSGPPKTSRPFLFAGRHALFFYIFHQPVIYGILLLLFKIIG
ncbi:MAG: heparan-alpha-glucosaminide N-acetyltransferase [Anaerovoracaceae bacterium]